MLCMYACAYVNWMSVYMILLCYSMWTYRVGSVFWLWNFVWKALSRLESCTHHFSTQQQHLHISLNKDRNLISHEDWTTCKKMWLHNGYLQEGLISFWTEKGLYGDRFPSFSLGQLHGLCVYFHSDFSLPAMKYWPHLRLWHLPWAGSDKSYLLSYVGIYIKLKGSGYFVSLEANAK